MRLRVDGDNHKNELVLFLQRRDQAGPGGRWLVSDFIVSEEDGTCGAAARARGRVTLIDLVANAQLPALSAIRRRSS